MLEFTLTQRGQVPVDAVAQAIVAAHQRAVTELLNELTKNVSGRVVQTRTGRLRAGLMAQIIQAKTGETVATVGFDKRVAFRARFLERGTRPHDIAVKRRRRRRRAPVAGPSAKRALSFLAGGHQVFARRVRHPGIRPRPILETAIQIAEPQIRADFEAALGRALES